MYTIAKLSILFDFEHAYVFMNGRLLAYVILWVKETVKPGEN